MSNYPRVFFIFCLFGTLISFGQNNEPKLYVGGNTQNLPNIQLYLDSNQSYRLKIFTKSCWSWQFYEGKYYFENDSLVLEYNQLYDEALCQIIDTFNRQRILNLIKLDEKGMAKDTLPLELNHDTVNVQWFPLYYLDTTARDLNKNSIKYTFYAPDFKSDEISIPFYEPKRKIKKTYFIKFKNDGNYLLINKRFQTLLDPFDKLKLE